MTVLRHSDDPPNAETPLAALDGGIVAVERFYVRCNFPVPPASVSGWRLDVGGLVERPRAWTLDELRSLPAVERTVTLECAGNGRTRMAPIPAGTPWDLGAVGTARFGGVALRDVLRVSRLDDAAVEVVFTGADRGPVDGAGVIPYQFGLDVESAAADGPILAWTMNGAPLTPEHGFPLRLVVPGQYGMRSVKWLTSILAVDAPFAGHFPGKYRYRRESGVADGTPVGPIRVRSVITWPADGERLATGAATMRGIAWSGHGAVTRVEAAVEGEWIDAEVGAPVDGTGPVRWTAGWHADPGSHVLAVRATDAAGHRQPSEPVWNEGGYGNNLVHRVSVEVSDAG